MRDKLENEPNNNLTWTHVAIYSQQSFGKSSNMWKPIFIHEDLQKPSAHVYSLNRRFIVVVFYSHKNLNLVSSVARLCIAFLSHCSRVESSLVSFIHVFFCSAFPVTTSSPNNIRLFKCFYASPEHNTIPSLKKSSVACSMFNQQQDTFSYSYVASKILDSRQLLLLW